MSEVSGHPLFPIDDDTEDDEVKTIDFVHIARKENGKLLFAPRMRSADEIQSLEQVHSEFGGGEYVLIGYYRGRIAQRRTINLSGKSKPLYDEGIEEPAKTSPQTSTASPDPMAAMMGGQPGGMWGLIMMMMQQMMQQQAQAAQNQMQMFMTIMTTSQQTSSEEKRQAREELQANIERERLASERTMVLMREMMQSKGEGSGEDFTRGVEFMRTFAVQQIEVMKAQAKGEETDWGSLIETVGQAIQGLNLFKQVQAGGLPDAATQVATEAAQ